MRKLNADQETKPVYYLIEITSQHNFHGINPENREARKMVNKDDDPQTQKRWSPQEAKLLEATLVQSPRLYPATFVLNIS